MKTYEIERKKKWKKIKQIHLQIHLYLSNQKPQCAENAGIKWLLGQCYTIRTVIDKLFEFHFHEY